MEKIHPALVMIIGNCKTWVSCKAFIKYYARYKNNNNNNENKLQSKAILVEYLKWNKKVILQNKNK